jgi:hypothetical protein
MAKKRFSSRLASDAITTHEYRALTFAKCITAMIVVLTVSSGLGSSRDCWVLGGEWFEMVLV